MYSDNDNRYLISVAEVVEEVNVWLFVLFVLTMKLVSKRARPIDCGARDGGSGPVRHAVC